MYLVKDSHDVIIGTTCLGNWNIEHIRLWLTDSGLRHPFCFDSTESIAGSLDRVNSLANKNK